MTTETEICNLALGAISARQLVLNLDEEETEAGIWCRRYYAITRDDLLRAAPWQCATVTDRLTLQKQVPGTPGSTEEGSSNWDPATMPAMPWLYQYAYPPECLFVRWVSTQLPVIGTFDPFSVTLPQQYVGVFAQPPTVRFEVGIGTDLTQNVVKCINTNVQCGILQYVRRVDNPDLWDPAFQMALVDALASRLAMPLTGKDTLGVRSRQAAMQTINQARTRDGNEGLTINNHTPDWIQTRGWLGNSPWANNGFFSAWATPSWLW